MNVGFTLLLCKNVISPLGNGAENNTYWDEVSTWSWHCQREMRSHKLDLNLPSVFCNEKCTTQRYLNATGPNSADMASYQSKTITTW